MKKIIILIVAILVFVMPVASADVNVTTNVDSDGGEINFWAYPNSGTGSTTYYLDGVDYRQSIRDAADSRSSIVNRVYKAFMEWRRQPTGEFAWQETMFEDLEPAYQRLRYVLETWFVPRSEMVQVIQNQQSQITQLQLEIEAISKVLGEDKVCDARMQVMVERGLESVTCGNRTMYPTGISIEAK